METELPEGYHPAITEEQREWIEALESGKYTKGLGALRSRSDKYCCLGVACDLFKDRFGIEEKPDEDTGEWTYDGKFGIAPDVLIEVLSLYTPVGASSEGNDGFSLVTLNDSTKKTFAEIADILKTGKYFKNCNV